ncbi:nucleoside recognition protein [Arenibaculum sp.]|uniref:nucleoside recognition protein n=1 Tax=Arenibaculum sp. TaxID=2865862 RepID=UPI002E15269D|nr:nucleoside recognition protein [Arenibaculum sp.]
MIPLLRQAASVYWLLLKTMVPVLVAMRIAQQLGVVDDLAGVLSPLMGLVGLPGETGIVWMTTLLISLYPGAAVFVALLPDLALTQAQVSVLCGMMLIAHALPLEQAIARCAGPSFWFTALLRFAGALAFGALLNLVFTLTGWLGAPASAPLWSAAPAEAGWLDWAVSTTIELVVLFFILLSLLALMAGARRIGLVDALGRLLKPMLRVLGLAPEAASITLVGLLLGLTYGGSLIIQEARTGRLSRRDVMISICFLCLAHSLIEDTLLMMALGADAIVMVLGRLVFALAAVALLARLLDRVPERVFRRLLFAGGDPVPGPAPSR